ncbi:DUF5996 family protein [Bailinhaonella thermotolerans]|uniref:Ava_C0101 and related proteins n=1 Tax=Bailinhaonella thermotolerans TaxID=1070861 RepID=A0A3A4ANY0_9ACTN|nr:DUF5996 family protein [Bailinhaonella thermotolerans]RJL23038.1 hypothetical protein D5H75_34250 [Bailinhaonella thermotolerans]
MELFPAIPLDAWADTKATVHRFAQIVGKVRLAGAIRRNHWWDVPFHLTGAGYTTRPIGLCDDRQIFTIDFDFVAHRLTVRALDGRRTSFPLAGQSVASFHDRLVEALDLLGVQVVIEHPHPFDLPDAGRPFAEDTEHRAYDPYWANRYWVVLSQVNLLLEEFSSTFSGKISPVHHFWHTFDIAVTRFGDRRVDQPASADPVTREAYSREVISAGFWFGDDHMAEPAFYSYTSPEPPGLPDRPLRPEGARWMNRGDSHLAVYPYETARAAHDPRAAALEFLQSAYLAGARLAGWDVDDLACPGGVTDPVLLAARRPGRPPGEDQDPGAW